MKRLVRHLAVAGAFVGFAACASAPLAPASAGPKYPDLPTPEIPAALRVTEDVRDRHAMAWRRLQSGDLRGATRDFTEVLRATPGFYPAETGLGLVALAGGQFKQAAARFAAALGRDNRYVPAWRGLVEAQLGLENVDEASAAMERLLALDPKREADRTRLELLRFRQVQALIESGRSARKAGRLGDAEATLTRALALSPASAVILRELALVEAAQGNVGQAEMRVRRSIEIDPNDADGHAALGSVLEARGRLREAAAAYGRAAALNASWREKADSVRALAEKAGVPDELREIGTAASVTRGELAALIGLRLAPLIERAPPRLPPVATDIRTHWAAPWIIPVTQAGVMDVFSNHTFQPAGAVRRGDLAHVIAQLLALAMGNRPDELARWRDARPVLVDLPASHLSYRPAALAVAAGAMRPDGDGRFHATRAATGADVVSALARLEQLVRR